MKRPFKALKSLLAFLLITSSFIACDKDFSVIESDVLGEDNSNFSRKVDSTRIIAAYNKKLEAVQINNLASNLLGFFNDPAFGKTTASIVSQMVPLSFNTDFGVNPVIDSIVVHIPYFSSVIGTDDNGYSIYALDSLYGNPNAEIKLSVYQNTYFLRDFDPGSSANATQKYFSNATNTVNSILTNETTVNFDDHTGELIFQQNNFIPSPDVTFIGTATDTTRSAPAFHLRITTTEAKAFWKTTILDKQGDAVLSNANNFKGYFRGLYFKAEAVNDDGNMILLNLSSSEANIQIHYTSGEIDARIQSAYTLNFSGNILNSFINDFSTPLDDGNSTEGDETLYLKGLEGSMAIVDLFPNGIQDFLDEFTDGVGNPTKLINEAQLVIYEDFNEATNGNYGNDYHKYDRIYAYDIKNNIPLIDYSYDQTDNTQLPFISKYTSLGLRDTISGKFKIRVTEHLKNILLRDSTNTKIGLVISNNVNYTVNNELLNANGDLTTIPSAAILSPRGTVLHGSNASVEVAKRLKLKIFYTEAK
ncbi:DUF4270 domain-containing protein [Flavobacteriaceae bacterium SZ-1-7]|uniref:DUF4270 domain-containing protein n=1 Tax=Tamlana sedimenti TaxID=3134126 RepID=UPI00312474A4